MTKFNCTEKMKEIMGLYYLNAKNAKDNNLKLAWVTSGAPTEFLYAMDVIPIYPENHSAMCATSKMSLELIQSAEAKGYPMEICSYARTDFGQYLTSGGPIYGLPAPDFLVAATNICKTVIKWYEEVVRNYNVPLFLIDMPFLYRGMDNGTISYVVNQFHEFIKFLENFLNRKFDKQKFHEVLIRSMEASQLWKRILELGKKKPSPFNSFDTFIHLAPIVTLRGTKDAVEYYKLLLEELTSRVENGIGSVENERIRLLWDNLPVWYKIKQLSEFFASNGAALVVATYTNSWAVLEENIDFNNPYFELARAYLSPYINRDFSYRIEYLIKIIDDFSLHGFVLHSDRSCKPYSLGQYLIKEEVTKRCGVPGLIIEADMNDPRAYSDAQIETRVKAFLENL